ncbi:hypothetical protein [Enterococcus phage vB_EFaS_ZC1]
MGNGFVAIRSNATGNILYDTEDWFFFRSNSEALPCKSIEYINMDGCGEESYYKVVFKVNEYTYEEHLLSSAYTGIVMIDKEED